MTTDHRPPTTGHRPFDDAMSRRSSVVGRQSSPFDAMAADYDHSFTDSAIGRLMRQAVWRHLDACFRPGDRVLELNCGTGADAIYLAQRGVRVLATDIAPAMLELARAKVARAGLADLVKVRQMAIEELQMQNAKCKNDDDTNEAFCIQHSAFSIPFDGALSNFGGLNCVADLGAVAAGLAASLRPGATVLLCVMGPLVPWEWAWFLWRGQPAKAFRRLRRGGMAWRGLTIRYPSLGSLRRAFAPWFHLRCASAVGALVPPSYAEGWAARHPRLLARLDRWERRLEALPPLPWLADHYLLKLERL
jgi:SAM-dependent methyltransferase